MKNVKTSNISNKNAALNSLNDEQMNTLCKRTHELDLICRKYNKDILNNDNRHSGTQIRLYDVNNPETGKKEYHFLSPDELEIVNKNVYKGKSGLSVANEMNMCYRKQYVDELCNI